MWFRFEVAEVLERSGPSWLPRPECRWHLLQLVTIEWKKIRRPASRSIGAVTESIRFLQPLMSPWVGREAFIELGLRIASIRSLDSGNAALTSDRACRSVAFNCRDRIALIASSRMLWFAEAISFKSTRLCVSSVARKPAIASALVGDVRLLFTATWSRKSFAAGAVERATERTNSRTSSWFLL